MDEYDVKRLALVLSVQADIEGMKAANIGATDFPVYTEDHFQRAAEELRVLASKHNAQL